VNYSYKAIRDVPKDERNYESLSFNKLITGMDSLTVDTTSSLPSPSVSQTTKKVAKSNKKQKSKKKIGNNKKKMRSVRHTKHYFPRKRLLFGCSEPGYFSQEGFPGKSLTIPAYFLIQRLSKT